MKKKNTLPFENYYDIVSDLLKGRGFEKAPDRDTVRQDYDDDKSAESSADEFAKEWGDLGDE